MVVGRLWQAEQHLQQPVDAGRPEQVSTAHDIGDALQGVIDDDGEMVTRRRIFARQNDIAPHLRRRGDEPALPCWPRAGLRPGQHPGAGYRAIHGEAERIGLAGLAAALALGCG